MLTQRLASQSEVEVQQMWSSWLKGLSIFEKTYPDAAVIILGDLNHCDLQKKNMPKLHLFVTFPTRENKTLDHCDSNIRNAFSAEPKPQFGKSDHLAIWLNPVFNKRLKTKPVTVRTVNTWTDDAQANLQGCLEATFKEATNDILWATTSAGACLYMHLSGLWVCSPTKNPGLMGT